MQEASSRRATSAWIVPILVCLISFGLRLGPLWANRFHPDEALYASWALSIAYGRDPLLAQVAPDKPPLLFYLMAGAFFVVGRVEVAGRLIGLMAGTLSVPLMWRLALISPAPFSQNWAKGETSAIVAAAAMALSPFAILFSPTAFLDPLMLALVLASLVAVTRKRPSWAGLWLGLAVATKVQALIFLPLTVGLFYHQDAKAPSLKSWGLGAFVVGLMIPLGAVLAWDRLRGGTPFWIQQTINYGGIRPIYSSEVMPRLIGWSGYLPYLLGWPMLIALAIGLPLLLVYDLTRRARTASAVLDLMLMTFTLGYFFLHWLLAFPIWDRYLLGLVPVMCLLVGKLVGWAVPVAQDGQPRGLPLREAGIVVLVIALMVPSAVQAWQSALPVGGDHGTQDGIDQVTDYVRQFPYGTVVYDHWLGWALHYYLWDARTYIAYFATPQTLAEDLRVFGRTSPRFIVVPSNESTLRIVRAIAVEGLALSPVLTTQNRRGQPTFTLYRIDSYAVQ
jgi:4-amino-4-deoxy-L-arabinose transferase-like glycosyltransferase